MSPVIFADGSISSFIPSKYFIKFPRILRFLILWFEIFVWKHINGIPNAKVEINFDNSSCDVLWTFSFRTFGESFNAKFWEKYEGTTYVHLSHIFLRASEKSLNISKVKNSILVSECDLKKISPFFKKIFSWYQKNVLVLPFSPQTRFISKKNILERQKKCVVTGTVHHIPNEEYPEYYDDIVNFYNTTSVHPIRKEIYNKKDIMGPNFKIKVSMYHEVKIKKSTENTYFHQKLMNEIVNKLNNKQKKYFSFDIVALYNDYLLALIPEEIVDLPGIGFFEAMSSGCVCLGKNNGIYESIGLVDGIHYIGYDGTLNDLNKKVNYYLSQERESELKKISEEAVKFVSNELNSQIILKKLIAEMQSNHQS